MDYSFSKISSIFGRIRGQVHGVDVSLINEARDSIQGLRSV